MPLYEFSCENCHEISEHLTKISDKAPEACPACEVKGGLKKLMSRTHFVLKGQGWYETDFKGQGEKKAQSSTSDSSAEKSTKPAVDSSPAKKDSSPVQKPSQESSSKASA